MHTVIASPTLLERAGREGATFMCQSPGVVITTPRGHLRGSGLTWQQTVGGVAQCLGLGSQSSADGLSLIYTGSAVDM